MIVYCVQGCVQVCVWEERERERSNISLWCKLACWINHSSIHTTCCTFHCYWLNHSSLTLFDPNVAHWLCWFVEIACSAEPPLPLPVWETKASVYIYDHVTDVDPHTSTIHLQYVKLRDEKKKCGVALKWRSLCFFGLPIKQNGDPNIWDHGWRMDFSRDESRSYTTKALHAYRTHSCIFMWTETKSSILYIGTWGQAFFAFQKNLCEEFLYFVLGCILMSASLPLVPLPSFLPFA